MDSADDQVDESGADVSSLTSSTLPEDRIRDDPATHARELSRGSGRELEEKRHLPEPLGNPERGVSPSGRRNSRVFDEDFRTWEDRIQQEFSGILTHIRTYLMTKDEQLQEYQIDLCQREKSLQLSENTLQERMASIMRLEEECQEKLDKLNLQIQDRMKLLREYELRITRLQDAGKKEEKEIQTDWRMAPDGYLQDYNCNLYKLVMVSSNESPKSDTTSGTSSVSMTHDLTQLNNNKLLAPPHSYDFRIVRSQSPYGDTSYQLVYRNNGPKAKWQEKRNSRKNPSQNGSVTATYGAPKSAESNSATSGLYGIQFQETDLDSDYVFMGGIQKQSSDGQTIRTDSGIQSDKTPDLTPIDDPFFPTQKPTQNPVENPVSLGESAASSRERDQYPSDSYVTAGSVSTIAVSSFNPAETTYNQTSVNGLPNGSDAAQQAQQYNAQFHDMPQEAIYSSVPQPFKPPNIQHTRLLSNDSQGGNSGSTQGSQQPSYGGERAMLVKRPLTNASEYSARALKYKNISAQHGARNTSLPPRSMSPETDKRSRSLPPDADNIRYGWKGQGLQNGGQTLSMEMLQEGEGGDFNPAYDPHNVHVVDRYIHNKSASDQTDRPTRRDYYHHQSVNSHVSNSQGNNQIPAQSRGIGRVTSNYTPYQNLTSDSRNTTQQAGQIKPSFGSSQAHNYGYPAPKTSTGMSYNVAAANYNAMSAELSSTGRAGQGYPNPPLQQELPTYEHAVRRNKGRRSDTFAMSRKVTGDGPHHPPLQQTFSETHLMRGGGRNIQTPTILESRGLQKIEEGRTDAERYASLPFKNNANKSKTPAHEDALNANVISTDPVDPDANNPDYRPVANTNRSNSLHYKGSMLNKYKSLDRKLANNGRSAENTPDSFTTEAAANHGDTIPIRDSNDRPYPRDHLTNPSRDHITNSSAHYATTQVVSNNAQKHAPASSTFRPDLPRSVYRPLNDRYDSPYPGIPPTGSGIPGSSLPNGTAKHGGVPQAIPDLERPDSRESYLSDDVFLADKDKAKKKGFRFGFSGKNPSKTKEPPAPKPKATKPGAKEKSKPAAAHTKSPDDNTRTKFGFSPPTTRAATARSGLPVNSRTQDTNSPRSRLPNYHTARSNVKK